MDTNKIVNFDIPKDSPKIIKVIGVGGGGGNAEAVFLLDGKL